MTLVLAPDPDGVATAARMLREGAVVAIPTETVYGLAADASNAVAVARVYEAKGRPPGHPLIVHVADVAAARRHAVFDERAERLAGAFWPGPLTLLAPRRDIVADVVTGGRPTVGLRVPSNPVAARLLMIVDNGLAAPSANRFGHVSPTSAQHVLADLDGAIDAVIDGGPCRVGLESTIIDTSGPELELLRPGAVSASAAAEVAGEPVIDGGAGESRAAGMMVSHYAPGARVEVHTEADASTAGPGVIVIGAGTGDIVLPRDPSGFGAELYRALRAADDSGAHTIWVVPPTGDDEFLVAIADRLAKASA